MKASAVPVGTADGTFSLMDGLLYPPLDCLKPLTADIWTVDGPQAWLGLPWPKVPFPTRMTIIVLQDRRLFIHSPTPLTPALRQDVERLGSVAYIVAPNRLHYSWLADWHREFPEASVFLAPRVREQAKDKADFPASLLDRAIGYPWDGEMFTLPVPGSFMTEFVFFHTATKTLVLTDLIECFEPQRLKSLWFRLLIRIGGVAAPLGGTPRDLRLTFNRPTLRDAVKTMLRWQPQRVVFAHGRFYADDGAQRLADAFAWLLRRS